MTIDFQKRAKQLQELLELPLLAGRWPDESATLTLPEALIACGESDRAQQLKHSLGIVTAKNEMLSRPIIGVLGELNAGKSSVVASFLSKNGRSRLPRGEDNENGTHRFVYWVPTQWMNDEAVKAGFIDLLDKTHGNRREYLSPDPVEAAAQYRSGIEDFDKIGIPLIADDTALDEMAAAFLDCPDAQTKDHIEGEDAPETGRINAPNRRLEFISKAANICSAFLLVWERGKLRDRMLEAFLENVRQRMPTVPLYLLINKIRPETGQPGKTRRDEDLQSLVERFNISGCYGAFDFDIVARGDKPGWEELTPERLVEDQQRSLADDDSPSPQFFRIEINDEENVPTKVDEHRFLSNLSQHLDPAELQRQKQRDNWRELDAQVTAGIESVRNWSLERVRRAQEIHDGLLQVCVSRFKDPVTGEPLQILSSEYTKAFADSVVRTSPIWARVLLKGTKPFDRGMSWCGTQLQALVQKVRGLNLRDHLFPELSAGVKKTGEGLKTKDSISETEKNFRELGVAGVQLSDAESLANQMHTCRWVPQEISETALAEGWKNVVQNANHFRLKYDDEPDLFDRETKEFWSVATTWQKTRLVGSSLLKTLGSIAAVGGVAVAVVDGGASLMVMHSFGASVAAALPGMGALGVAALGGAGALAGVHLSAVNHNTLPNLSRYFAFACDAFGVPRKIDDKPIKVSFGKGEKKNEFVLPEPKVPRQSAQCPLDDIRLWKESTVVSKINEIFADE